MEYNFKAIEKKWQEKWVKQGTYNVFEDPSRPKYYVLNMFPYPSGTACRTSAGLHSIGHICTLQKTVRLMYSTPWV